MSVVPRIARAIPHGPVIRPEVGLPVVACLRWANGADVEVLALATAWTQEAVEIRWVNLNEVRTDWVPAGDVCRSAEEQKEDSDHPPSSRGQLKKNRW
jgi:hypothetical protein